MNRKALFLVIFGLVIITALFLMISVWAYQDYFSKKSLVTNINKTSILKKPAGDSTILGVSSNPEKPAVITSGINETDTTTSLEEKIREYDSLRNELVIYAGNKTIPSDSIQTKIAYLEKNILELKERNEKVAADNKRLGILVKQLAGSSTGQKITKSLPSKKSLIATSPSEESKYVSVNNVSLRLYSENMSPALSPSNAEGLQGSFNVKNLNQSSGVFNIVLLLPDGKVLRQSGWETGIFNTPSGKKVYTIQVHLNAESETMQFTVKSSSLTDGIYTLQIYFDGKMVGQLRKRLG